MKLAVGLIVCTGLTLIGLGYFLSPDRSPGNRDFSASIVEHPSPPNSEPVQAVLTRPEDPPTQAREAVQEAPPTHGIDGPPTPLGIPEPSLDAPVLTLDEAREILANQRLRIVALESRVAQLIGELDECRNGQFSVLGIARSLPEWPAFDNAQRIRVMSFLERFPVKLGTGEAHLIATYQSPTGDTTKELIAQLGRQRVLATLTPEARAKFLAEDPEEFEDYFGKP
jgi:hypothetical protein